jgi:hypothetical protein
MNSNHKTVKNHKNKKDAKDTKKDKEHSKNHNKEHSKNHKKDKDHTNKSNSYKCMDDILLKLFEHQLLIKMFHFQTCRYSTHKVMDKYLDKFQDTFDTYMEVYQGLVKKRVSLKELKIHISMVKDEDDMIDELERFIKKVLNCMMDIPLDNNNSLLNIRDEMVANAQNTQYLLTFK